MSIQAITGNSGAYDARVSNPSIRYGRNSASNMQKFTEAQINEAIVSVGSLEYKANPKTDGDIFAEALERFAENLEQDTFTPAKYRYQYSTVDNGEVNKLALLGAAYEQMGEQSAVPVKKMTQMLQSFFPAIKPNGKQGKSPIDAKVLDTNKNHKVEVEEYGAFLALADIKSEDKNSKDVSLMNGVITEEGTDEAISHLAVNAKNPITRHKLTKYMRGFFKDLQNSLNLDEAKSEFKKNEQLDFMA